MGYEVEYTVCCILLQFVFIEEVLSYILNLRLEQEGSLAIFGVTVGIYLKKFQMLQLQMMSKY